VDALVSVLSDTGRVLAERRAPSLGTHLVTRLRESSSTGPISAAAFVQVRLRTAPKQSPYSDVEVANRTVRASVGR
jgi:hypothetical protein